MTAIQRRRLIWTGVRTTLLTMAALALSWSGSLTRFERLLYDLRALRCQWFVTPPTTQLVHLDIDDNALTQIGRWPWEREKLADILDEIRLAGPKVLAMDVLFPEPAPNTFDREGKRIDPDEMLAESLRKFGRVLVPTSLTFEHPTAVSAVNQQLLAMLIGNPELTVEQCCAQLRAAGMNSTKLADDVNRDFLTIRSRALYERTQAEIQGGLHDAALIKKKMLPHADPLVVSLLDRQFDREFVRAAQDAQVMRFTLPLPPGHPPIIQASESVTPITPLAEFSAAAKFGAFVDYLQDGPDGTVRQVPLMAEYRGRLLPHMTLATACAMLDVDVKDLRMTDNAVTIPRPGGRDIVIPVVTRHGTEFGEVGLLMEVPMFGKRDGWLTMYDYPAHQKPTQHVSVNEAWRICQTRQQMARNDTSATLLLRNARENAGANVPPDDALVAVYGAAKRKLIIDTIADLIAATSDPDLPAETKAQMIQVRKPIITQLSEVLKQTDVFQEQLTRLRDEFHEKLHGKAIFLGGIGTGNIDMHPTSLDNSCPGVIVHGAVFNAILTGRMWRVAPQYTGFLIITAIGLLTGLFAGTLSPMKAFLATSALTVGYLAINGFVLFDYGRIIVLAGGPMAAAAMVWSGITLTNFIFEVAERRRITHRFSNYVDPSLVNWVIEHPEQARFDGETREMTMGFTDLAGFTHLSETLGERAVPLLAEYMGHMIPAIRANRGYVSRLMGDGIFFFFNAPAIDPDHASHAVSTMLAMHKLLDQMNQTLPQRGLPMLAMRGGITTGRVILGDAGSKEFSDYTAIGDAVNTAARLESANKVFGTRILANARTIELLDGAYLFRPIANLRVAGKAKGVDVYEPLCRKNEETPECLRLVELSVQVVSTFQCGNFQGCVEFADRLERELGVSKFSALYRLLALQYQEATPGDFDGQVVLTEK